MTVINNNVTKTSGISLWTIGIITWIVFLVLKLCNPTFSEVVSWFWVWFPLWIVPASVVAIFILMIPLIFIAANDN